MEYPFLAKGRKACHQLLRIYWDKITIIGDCSPLTS